MGMHMVNIIIVVGIGLLLFGPKALQSVARSAGKSAAEAKQLKEKLMAELPLEEISKVTNSIPQVPLNSRQALNMLLSSGENKQTTKTTATPVQRQSRVEPEVKSVEPVAPASAESATKSAE